MKNYIAFFCVAFLLFMIWMTSCSQPDPLESDNSLTLFFSKQQIEDIGLMIKYADIIVTKKTKESDINLAYHAYFDYLKRCMFEGEYVVPLKNAKSFLFFDEISESTYGVFWHLAESFSFDSTSCDENPIISLNINGAYVKYLEKLGVTDSFFYYLHDNISFAGDLSRSQLILRLSNDDTIDFRTNPYRILAMVCVFSIYEPLSGGIKPQAGTSN